MLQRRSGPSCSMNLIHIKVIQIWKFLVLLWDWAIAFVLQNNFGLDQP